MNEGGKCIASIIVATALAGLSYAIVGECNIVTFLFGGLSGLIIRSINGR